MAKKKTFERYGVVVRDLGSRRTRNGISWAASVTMPGAPGGSRFIVENDGNGGCDHWRRDPKDVGHGIHTFDGVREAEATLGGFARLDLIHTDVADCLASDHEAAGLWVCAILDGMFETNVALR